MTAGGGLGGKGNHAAALMRCFCGLQSSQNRRRYKRRYARCRTVAIVEGI